MPKTYPVRNSFNAGEVSQLVSQRDDVSKYASACLTCENSMPLVEGGAKKMPGTYFAGATARGGSMFTASIAGTSLTVTETNYGVIQIGQTVVGQSVSPGTEITGTLTTPGVPIYTTTSANGNGSQGATSGDWQFVGTQFRTHLEPTTTALGDMTILCPVAGVPVGATILGVQVTVNLVSQFGSAATVTGVALWNGSQLGAAKTPGTGFSTTAINYSYGSSGDLWGNTSAAILAALPTLALSVSVNVPDSTRIFVGIVQPTVTVTYSYQSGVTPPVPVPGGYVVSISQTVASEMMQTVSDGKSRLVPFQFSTAQGAVLEFSQGIVRIWEGATQGQWSLGLALQLPNAIEYNPVTPYNPGDLALVGPSYSVEYFHLPGGDHGRLTVGTPYGTTNAATVPITFTVNTADALVVTATGSSPNQGINIALANTSPANNAATLIQSSIRALGSINLSGNTVDLTAWTVTPDSVYYATPLIVAPNTLLGWYNVSYVAQAEATNQFDQSPNFDVDINTAYWQVFTPVEPPIELITPYLEADLFALDCSTQSADVLWIFHASYPPAVIERLGPNSWEYSLSLPGQQPGEPPYRGTLGVVKTGYSALGQSITAITLGNPPIISVAASTLVFNNGDRVYVNLIAGTVELNQGEFIVENATLVGGVLEFNLLDPNTLDPVDASAYQAYVSGGFVVKVSPLFAAAGDYPACGTLYQERLTVGGSNNNPTQLNGSVQDDYPDFICDPNEADYAIQFTLVGKQPNPLLNMIGTPNALLIGTSGGVWVLTASTGSSISQTNIDAALQASMGVSPLEPQLVNGSAIFVSRSTRIVTFLVFNFGSNSWESNDLTRLNRNITLGTSEDTSGIAQTAFQMEPYPVFWGVRNDGQLIGLVFNTQDQVYAWFRVNMTPQGGYIESATVITGSGQEDQLSVVVRRTINGVTTRFVEYFMPQELFGDLSNAFFVHSGQQLNLGTPVNIASITQANPPVVGTMTPHGYTNGQTVQIMDVLGMTQINQSASQAYAVAGATTNTFTLVGMDTTAFSAYTSGGTVKAVTNTVTGLSYLLGNTVTAVGDEALVLLPPTVVTSDSITFPYYSNVITIGIPYQYILQPTNPVLSSQGATTRGMPQKLNRVSLSVYQSMGGKMGTDLNHMYDLNYGPGSQAQTPAMTTALFTEDLDADWSESSTFYITQDEPLPFTLRGIVFRMSANQD